MDLVLGPNRGDIYGQQWQYTPLSDNVSGSNKTQMPLASFGGVWERLIRSVRKALTFVVKEQVLTDESLATVMCEAEAIINSRPIMKVSDDPQDLEALTLSHLLLLRQGSTMAPGEFDAKDIYKKRWRQTQHMANLFWKRWTQEYLPLLQERNQVEGSDAQCQGGQHGSSY